MGETTYERTYQSKSHRHLCEGYKPTTRFFGNSKSQEWSVELSSKWSILHAMWSFFSKFHLIEGQDKPPLLHRPLRSPGSPACSAQHESAQLNTEKGNEQTNKVLPRTRRLRICLTQTLPCLLSFCGWRFGFWNIKRRSKLLKAQSKIKLGINRIYKLMKNATMYDAESTAPASFQCPKATNAQTKESTKLCLDDTLLSFVSTLQRFVLCRALFVSDWTRKPRASSFWHVTHVSPVLTPAHNQTHKLLNSWKTPMFCFTCVSCFGDMTEQTNLLSDRARE